MVHLGVHGGGYADGLAEVVSVKRGRAADDGHYKHAGLRQLL